LGKKVKLQVPKKQEKGDDWQMKKDEKESKLKV
jgi:hypothetical protein